LGLAWAALGMFSAVRWGLNRAFGASRRASMVRVQLLDLGAGVMIWLLLLASAVGSAALHLLTGESEGWAAGATGPEAVFWSIAQWAIPALFTVAAFVFLYRYVPNVHNRYRDVVPAAIVAALLFELSKYLFSEYMEYVTSHQRIYSALGGTFGFLLWVYVSAVTMLFGAEFSWSYRHRRAGAGDRAATAATTAQAARKEGRGTS
jgi:membrane protein